MSITAAALASALLLSQVESEGHRLERLLEERSTHEQTLPEAPLPPFPVDGATDRPKMRAEEKVLCARFPPTKQVPSGTYRLQCNEETRECLVAPAHELDSDGEETDRLLERVAFCEPFIDGATRAQEGYRFVAATADAPWGWYRDERGRVMQFNFDLHRRVWLGAAWAPLWSQDEERMVNRLRMDFGIRTEFPSDDRHYLHRLSFLDTELYLGERRGLDFTLLHYDYSADRDRPFMRVTTFLGKPRRLDLEANVGGYFEAGRLEWLRREGTEASFLTLGTAHLTLDLWHSRDMVSFIRVRGGPSLEQDRTNHMATLVAGAALEGDLTLDADGFHHVTFGTEAERVYLDDAVEGRPLHPERLRLRAGYEAILLALNDQPVSFVLDGRGTWRSDLAGVPAVWEWSAQAGLRFSLWAPARRLPPRMAVVNPG